LFQVDFIHTGLDFNIPGMAVSMDDQPYAWPAMPFRAELQPILYRRGAKIRSGPRLVARHIAHLPLPPLASRRIRSALKRMKADEKDELTQQPFC
jgi:hypothetical protein